MPLLESILIVLCIGLIFSTGYLYNQLNACMAAATSAAASAAAASAAAATPPTVPAVPAAPAAGSERFSIWRR